MAAAPCHLPFDELQQIPLVVDLRQAVDDGEPVDLLVILGLDRSQFPPEKELEDGRADLDQIARAQGRVAAHLDVVQVGAVGRAVVAHEDAVLLEQQRAVPARDVVQLEDDLAGIAAPDGGLVLLEDELLPQAGPVDLHQAGLLASRRGGRGGDGGDPGDLGFHGQSSDVPVGSLEALVGHGQLQLAVAGEPIHLHLVAHQAHQHADLVAGLDAQRPLGE